MGMSPVAGAIGAAYIGAGGPDIMDGQTDAAGALGNLGGLFEGVIDAVDAVILHGKQEAGTPSAVWGRTGIEQGAGSRV